MTSSEQPLGQAAAASLAPPPRANAFRLSRITISNFRNIEALDLALSPHATVAVGPNGEGKTNFLEAIFFLATLKPLRGGKLSELVRFGTQGLSLSGRFYLRGTERQLSVQVANGIRQGFVDGKRAASFEEYFGGGVPVVSFTPDDLAIVKGPPGVRRRFLDRTVFNRFPAFLEESRDYARALKSRNRLLRDQSAESYLQAYDQAVAKLGARVWSRRREVVAEIAPRAAAAFHAIAGAGLGFGCTYQPTGVAIEPQEELSERALLAALRERTVRDMERGFTSVGPHADDLQLSVGGHPARIFASQGQQRALVLAWKIGEIENLEVAHGAMPLLLLDDVSSELDPDRNAYLMGYLACSGAQVFLTTTDARLVAEAAGPRALWCEVRGGRFTAAQTKIT